MGILDILTGHYPSSDWVFSDRFTLQVNLSEPSLCRVPLEGRYDLLEGLGPAENRKEAKKGNLCYYSRGFEFGVDQEELCLDHFRLVWNDDLFYPWEGVCILDAREISLTTASRSEDIIEIFGEPYESEEDKDGLELQFEVRDVLIDVDFTPDDRLWSISIW